MREFKFRAWNGNKMIQVDTFHVHIKKVESLEHQTWDWYRKDYKIMQYIGLKDKNGVEIYHKDIVLREGLTYVVEWDEKHATFYLHDTDNDIEYHLCIADDDVIEVIGNVFQTPELLEGKS